MTRARTAPEPLWSRDLVLAATANLFVALVFYMLMTTMAVYAVDAFAASDAGAGLASSMFVLGAVVTRLVAGSITDLLGRRRVLLVSLVVFVLASLAYLGVGTLGPLLAVRAVHGVAFGLATTAASAIAQTAIPPSRRAEGTGYFTLSATLATAIGPFGALLLVREVGYPALFVATGVSSVLGLGAALLLRTADQPLDADARARLRRLHPADMLHPAVLPVATFMFVQAVGFSGILTFLNSYALDSGLEAGAGLFFLVYAVVLFAARLVAGRLQDRRGDDVVVYTAVVSFAAGLAVLGLATTDAVLLVAGGLCGAGFGTLMSAVQAIAVSRVPIQRVGLAVSTQLFMVDLGAGVGPVVLGLVLHRLGYGQMYLALAGLVLLSALLYRSVHGRRYGGRPTAREAQGAAG